jgi:hypothetical protein
MKRLFIGLGIPVLAIVPTIPLLSHLHIAWFGIDIRVWWLFLCMPLTSLCLACCWLKYDRHQADETGS